MKRIYLLFAFLISFSLVRSQALLTEEFEGATFPPTGWTLINGGFANAWTSNTNAGLPNGPYPAHSGTKSMAYGFDAGRAANAWALTPSLNLTSGVSYAITFAYRVLNSNYPEKLKVTVGNAATIAAQNTVLWNNNNGIQLTNTAWQIGVIQYTPSTSGSFNFGFNCYSAANQFGLVVDDIRVEITPAVTPACVANNSPANGATNVSNQVTFDWGSSPDATSYDFYISTQNLPTTVFNNYAGTSVTLTAAYNTTYYWYVVPRNAAGSATGCVSSITSFTTAPPPCAALITPANDATSVNDTTQFKWNAVPGVDGYTVVVGTTNPPKDTLGFFEDTALTLIFSRYNTTYYWSVIPQTATGSASNCEVRSFVTEDAPLPPVCTSIIEPTSGATGVSTPITTLKWNSTPSATQYIVLFGDNESGMDTIGIVSDTSISVSGTEFSTAYQWSVIPGNGGGFASDCAVNEFTTTSAPTAPGNDDCENAVEITSTEIPVAGSTIGATQSIAAEECGDSDVGDANDDVWYKFTTKQAGDLTVTLKPGGDFDGIMVAYSGNCGALVSIACADNGFQGLDETLTLSNLEAGKTYYFRVYGWAGLNEGGEGSFTLTISGSVLPVEISSFKGERQGADNVLSWSTETEQNNKGFELQRSADGRNFSAIAFITSKANNGNSTLKQDYRYIDGKASTGDNYYQLKQVDRDGKTSLSPVVIIKGIKARSLVLSNVYPNPAKATVNIVLNTPSTERVIVLITDLAGKTVLQKATQLVAGQNNLPLNVAKLPGGTYLIKAVCESGCETAVSKFVKQ